MRKFILAASLMAIAVPFAAVQADPPSWAQNDKHDRGRGNERNHHDRDRGDRHDGREISRYDYNRPDPRYGDYRAERYYTQNQRYGARHLGPNDRIYRGRDNRYYCRRADGTTGLIIGGLVGGVLGNAIAPGGSRTLGALLGGGAGALLGRSIDRDNVTCR